MSGCVCYLVTGEQCKNKAKPLSLYCGVHKNCKRVKLSPLRKSPLRKSRAGCQCYLVSGESCKNKAKPLSLYCGVHKNCKRVKLLPPRKSPLRKSSPPKQSRSPPLRKSSPPKQSRSQKPKRKLSTTPKRKSPAKKRRHSPKRKYPTKLSPKQIANSIVNTVDIIEGTYFCNIMVPNKNTNTLLERNAPVFVLLSDIHVGTQKCIKECLTENGCYSLYTPASFIKYINDFSKTNSISTDLFLELWAKESSRKDGVSFRSSVHNSALVDVSNLAGVCLSHTRIDCPFPNMRTHMADVRHVVSNITINTKAFWSADDESKYLGDSVITPLLNTLLGSKLNKTSILAIKELLYEKFPDFTPKYILRFLQKILVSDFTKLDYFNEPFVQKYSRTYHEWIQLPKPLRDKLYSRAKILYDRNRFFYNKSSNNLESINNFFDMIIDKSEYPETQPKIATILFAIPLKIFIVDIYTISRSLKTFKGGLPSQLSVIYLGGAHIENIMYLIEGLYTTTKTYGKVLDMSKLTLETVKDIDKCAKRNAEK